MALSVVDCFSTIHITPEQIGLPEKVTFKIPFEDGNELLGVLESGGTARFPWTYGAARKGPCRRRNEPRIRS